MNRALASICLSACTIAPLTLTGCTGSTSSGVAYTLTMTRHVEAFIAENHETIYETALDTLDETFMYEIERNELDGRTGVVKARTAKNNIVTFTVTRDSDAMSKVSIFVGPVGDEEAAQDILNRVAEAL